MGDTPDFEKIEEVTPEEILAEYAAADSSYENQYGEDA